MPGYNPIAIEKKWQQHWAANKSFATDAKETTKPKYYVLDMFPYPSGSGLHVGHPLGYIATDIIARYKRVKGFNVMHPMGWDAFGLPAEQYAIKNNVHPRETTAANIDRFRKQLQALGLSYDWDREVDTTDPGYYRWTQWIFLKLYDTWFDEKEQRGRGIEELVEEFEGGSRKLEVGSWKELSPTERRKVLAGYRLAYESEAAVNWCAGLGTVLSNEEVIDGKSEVGGFPVERKPMRQWMLRITAYANRLIEGLEKLEWSESLKEMQRNWIGQSEGAIVKFEISSDVYGPIHPLSLFVFTTRPDTLFGATYMVIAPEHTLLTNMKVRSSGEGVPFRDDSGELIGWIPASWPSDTKDAWKGNSATPLEAVHNYQKWTTARSERERQEDTRKTGVFTGIYAINPVDGSRIPIFTSDYVLMGYGTGAIMAVPAHDERDHEFAVKFGLPIIQVVEPRRREGAKDLVDVQKEALVAEGVAVNSPGVDGLGTAEAKSKMISILEEKGIGKRQINYKIRDWLFSRQRYWGEPFPLVHLPDGSTVRLADSELPLKLPELEDFKPTGTIDPPLSKATDWLNVHVVIDNNIARVVPEGTSNAAPARRELNTMPQWAGSCWYYIRYLDPKNAERFVDPAIEKYWLGASDGNAGVSGVDMYVGGVEHAVLHLLYSRFWHKVLFDRGLVSHDEPFRKLVNQGLMLGEPEYTTFRTDSGGQRVSIELVENPDELTSTLKKNVPLSAGLLAGQTVNAEKLTAEQVEKRGEHFILKEDPAIRIDARSFKMSKSRGNVINPDDIIADYGADSLRMFEMFMGPIEAGKPWSTAGVEGVYRFLQRVWRNMIDSDETDLQKANKLLERHPEGKTDTWWTVMGDLPVEKHAQAEADYQAILRPLHRTIKKVTEDIERLSFNTAIAAMMEFNNVLAKVTYITLDVAESFLRLLEPFAPHFADEVLSIIRPDLRGQGIVTISHRPWPIADPAMLMDATIEVPVQINGKLRSRITVANDAEEATVLSAALADPEIQRQLAGKGLKKKIYVKGRMVNLVI